MAHYLQVFANDYEGIGRFHRGNFGLDNGGLKKVPDARKKVGCSITPAI